MGKVKIFALPNAGGTAKLFQNLKGILSDRGMELQELEYARHGTRASEPGYSSFSEMADDMADMIRKSTPTEDHMILFGYSMGALVTYDVFTRCFSDEERARTDHLFLAAHEPPHIEFCGARFADCDEATFIAGMQEMGGLDERLLRNPRFLKIFLSQIRGDYQLINGYSWNGKTQSLTVPTTVMYSEEDTPLTRMIQWKEYVVPPNTFRIEEFEGGHFFIRNAYERIADLLVESCSLPLP